MRDSSTGSLLDKDIANFPYRASATWPREEAVTSKSPQDQYQQPTTAFLILPTSNEAIHHYKQWGVDQGRV